MHNKEMKRRSRQRNTGRQKENSCEDNAINEDDNYTAERRAPTHKQSLDVSLFRDVNSRHFYDLFKFRLSESAVDALGLVLYSILIEFYFVDPLRRFHFGHIFGRNENNCVAMGRTNTNTMRCEEIQRKIGTHRLYTDMCLQMAHAHNVPTIFCYEEKTRKIRSSPFV